MFLILLVRRRKNKGTHDHESVILEDSFKNSGHPQDRPTQPNPIQSSYTTPPSSNMPRPPIMWHLNSQQQPDPTVTPKQAKLSEKNKQPHTTSTCSHTSSATLHCCKIPHSTARYITAGLENAAHQMAALCFYRLALNTMVASRRTACSSE